MLTLLYLEILFVFFFCSPKSYNFSNQCVYKSMVLPYCNYFYCASYFFNIYVNYFYHLVKTFNNIYPDIICVYMCMWIHIHTYCSELFPVLFVETNMEYEFWRNMDSRFFWFTVNFFTLGHPQVHDMLNQQYRINCWL